MQENPASSSVSTDSPGAASTPSRIRSLRSATLTVLAWIAAPAVITVVSWAGLELQPGGGIDQSWVASLQMAAHEGLTFGRQAVFTYGPLGFLDLPEFFHVHLAQLGYVYELVVRLAVAAALYHTGRVTFGRVLAFVVAVVVISSSAGLAQMGELALPMIACGWTLASGIDGRRATGFVAAFAAFGGFELLLKVSIGFSVLLMAVVLALTLPGSRWRNCAAAFAGWLVTLAIFWLAAGQLLWALPDYIIRGIEISSGYTPAMSIDAPGIGWEYTAALVGLGVGLWAGWRVSGDWPRTRRVGLLVVWLAFWFGAFKEGFVRHDSGHGLYFFVALMLGFFAFRWGRAQRGIALVCVGFLLALALAAQSTTLTADVTPAHDVSVFFTDLGDYASSSKGQAIETAGRNEITSTEPLDARALTLFGDATMAVFPIEQAQAWAYRLDWDPIPVFQSYQAYTSSLDALDASFLASSRAPAHILYEGTPGVDGRLGAFDESQTLREMFCRYRLSYATSTYSVLTRQPDRCTAPPRLISTVRAKWGQSVTVPRPAARGRFLIYVRIYGTAASGVESLESLFFKPAQRFVDINGGGVNRLVTGTATDGLPLLMSAGADWPPPYNIAQGAEQISVTKGSGSQPGGTPITYRFYSQPIS